MRRLDGFWLAFLQALVMGSILLIPLYVLAEVWRVGDEPVVTPTPMPLPTIVTLAPLPTLTPTRWVLPTATATPFRLPTATPTPDAEMTEIAYSLERGNLAAFIAETPVVKGELAGTPFALCNPNYGGTCVAGGLTRAFCYDIGQYPFTVLGEDVLGFDQDGDGTACEVYDDWNPN